MCCCNCWALTLTTVCLNTEWAIGIWRSWLKHLNCWWKAVKKKLFFYSWIFNVQLHLHLKKWTLKFKLLYLRNYMSYLLNMLCEYSHSKPESLAQNRTTVAEIQHFFLRDCFLMAHPVDTASVWHNLYIPNVQLTMCWRWMWSIFRCNEILLYATRR